MLDPIMMKMELDEIRSHLEAGEKRFDIKALPIKAFSQMLGSAYGKLEKK